ncbi:MAG: glycosyltransferase family 4 protein [Deltaproteobacteria bacterium]|jgi:glycosyltransferase involved in cell wall biosynthesis|nr:glycosyltransferase family 4 protein [Deltaproteobacteria bacterium]
MKKTNLLFIKPGAKVQNQLWAIHHFAAQVSLRDDFTVNLATSNFSFDKKIKINTLTIYPPLAKSPYFLFGYLKRFFALAKLIKTLRPAVVYVNNHIGAAEVVFLANVLGKDTKCILDIRTLPDKKWKYFYYKVITPFFDHIFALNNDIIEKMVNNSSTSLLPLGYDPDFFFKDVGKCQFSTKAVLRCLYYGSLDKKRKLLRLISGVNKAVKKGCKIRLTILGSGNSKNELLQYVSEKEMESIVTVHDFLPQHQLRKVIWDHDLGVAFVPDEGMYRPQVPLKAVEMLACGLPVIATDTNGNREIIQDSENGYIIKDDAKSVCCKMQELWENGVSEKIYQNAAKSIEHLTWHKIVKTWLSPKLRELLRNDL